MAASTAQLKTGIFEAPKCRLPEQVGWRNLGTKQHGSAQKFRLCCRTDCSYDLEAIETSPILGSWSRRLAELLFLFFIEIRSHSSALADLELAK